MVMEVGIADLEAMAMEVDMGDLAAMAVGIDIGDLATGGGDNSGELVGGGPIPSQQVSLVISTPQRLSLQ